MSARTLRIAAALLLSGALLGCRRGDDISPPAIVYGQTECSLCRMIISEEPFAAGAVVVTSAGVNKTAFDDVGCLLDFLPQQPPDARVIAYVHDLESKQWLNVEQAHFVRSDKLHTPMASHLAAVATPESATRLATRFPGEVLTWAQVRSPTTTGPTSRGQEPEPE